MAKSIEGNIRRHAVILYLLVAVICGGMIVYLYDMRDSIESQRMHIESYHEVLSLTNEVIYTVNQAQSSGNLYVTSKNASHLRRFRNHLKEIETLADSLSYLSGDTIHAELLGEMVSLLQQKGRIIYRLNDQFNEYNPLDTLSQHLLAYEPPEPARDSVIVSTVVSDTIVNTPPKRNFWKRLANAFSPETPDTVITVQTWQRDTVMIIQPDTLPLVSEVSQMAEQARITYMERMSAFERQLRNLLVTDQEISVQITEVVNRLYREILNATLEEIAQSEEYIRRNYTYSIIGGVASLVMILLLIVMIISDVNKGYAARRALEQAHAQVREVMESRHKLLLAVSHDIKTPLHSILGYLDLWKKDRPLEENQVLSMRESGHHIEALLENLLRFSNLEQGTLQLSVQLFNFSQLCRETVEMFRPLAGRKGLKLVYDYDFDGDLWLCSDMVKIRQVLSNVLSNAVKYTSEGIVEFRVRYLDGKIYFRITDTGAGFPAGEKEKLFLPFTRIEKNNALADGNGFGMYVVKGLIDLLGGDITVSSVEGEGTEVCLVIPAERGEAPPESGSKHILIVDDDDVLLRLLREMLQRLGHRVTTWQIREGEVVILPDLSAPVDLVITDMEMGRMRGTDILRRIRQIDTKVSVILMSGRGDLNREQVQEMGFADYLAKPFNLSILAVLTGKELREEFRMDTLAAWFEEDPEGLQDFIDSFVVSCEESLIHLKEASVADDFDRAQRICHKLLPLFTQLEAARAIPFLQRMDAHRHLPDGYEGWQKELQEWFPAAFSLLEKLKAKN